MTTGSWLIYVTETARIMTFCTSVLRALAPISMMIITSVCNQAFQFEVVNEIHDVTCSGANVVFGTSNVNMAGCASECSQMIDTCTGFTLNNAQKQCVGCNISDASTDLDKSTPGMQYYEMTLGKRWGCSCFVEMSCQGGNQTCLDGKCVCVPGYSFDRTSWSCEPGCVTYGTTFQMYALRGLVGNDDEVHRQQSIESCKALCVARGWCRSIDFANDSFRCYLSSVTALQVDPADYRVLNVDHYTRNCQ